jgi:tetratricopeptide (TPR) repeat protein
MFFVAAVSLKFWRPLRADQRWHDRVMVGTGFAAWAALLVHSLVDFNLHIPANAHLFFALTGLALGRLKSKSAAGHWSTISLARLGRWLGGALILLSVVYGFEVARTALGDFAYEKAFGSALVVPTEDSINAAEEALKYDGGNAQDLVFLGDLYRYEGSRQSDMAGRVQYGERALAVYREALKANGLDDTIGARMGMTFDFMGRYPEAFFCYETAVKAQPYNGEFWFALGNHFRERGILDRAEEAYVRSEQCPHGSEGSAEAIKELRALPEMQNVPAPGPDVDPLASPEAPPPASAPR